MFKTRIMRKQLNLHILFTLKLMLKFLSLETLKIKYKNMLQFKTCHLYLT